MTIDPENPVVALCAAGIQLEGTPAAARSLFEQAWSARRDDYDASIAAHFLARQQATPADALHWNEVAVERAEAVTDGRAEELMASLYLNLGDAQLSSGNRAAAAVAVERATASLCALGAGGYRDFVELGIQRLRRRIEMDEGTRAT